MFNKREIQKDIQCIRDLFCTLFIFRSSTYVNTLSWLLLQCSVLSVLVLCSCRLFPCQVARSMPSFPVASVFRCDPGISNIFAFRAHVSSFRKCSCKILQVGTSIVYQCRKIVFVESNIEPISHHYSLLIYLIYYNVSI